MMMVPVNPPVNEIMYYSSNKRDKYFCVNLFLNKDYNYLSFKFNKRTIEEYCNILCKITVE